MKIQIVNKSSNELPKYESSLAAGMDLRADLWELQSKCMFNSAIVRNEKNEIDNVTIYPGGRALIPTGLHIALPEGYEAQVRPRSGLAIKFGITVLNTPGTIDADYRGGIGVILINLGQQPFEIHQGDRIAQMVIAKHEQAELIDVEVLDETERGEGGFGHSGQN